MKRYWISWYSGYYEDEGCTTPPIETWITGERDIREDERTELIFCAVVDVEDHITEDQIWDEIEKYFPDYSVRFFEEKPIDFTPSDRFPDFQNKTKLI